MAGGLRSPKGDAQDQHPSPLKPLRLCAFAVLSPIIVASCEDYLTAEVAEVGAEERGGRFPLRPWQETLRPLRLIGWTSGLVAGRPRHVFAF